MIKNCISKIERGINHYCTKWKAVMNEKRYSSYGTRVKYMFFMESKSSVLLVSFPACAPNTAKYNYMRTLLPFKCNKLFLLDDFGNNHQGCYLVEKNIEKCVRDLIISKIGWCKQQNGVDSSSLKVIFLGSSKGGYSALNFSFLIPGVHVIIGSPQYYLGTYLDKQDTRDNLRFLIGEITEAGKKILNNRLKELICTSDIQPEAVYFHYSNVEHTYSDHVADLLCDLKSVGVTIYEDVQHYPKHSGLKDFYPPFLVKTIKSIINQ